MSSPDLRKISVFQKLKSGYMIRHPVPLEGRWPSSLTLGRGAVDAAAPARKRDRRGGPQGVCERSNGALTNGAWPGEACWRRRVAAYAKSCGPDASAVGVKS